MAANQEQIEARLAAYIDGELSAAERAEIEKHLAANPQHRKLIEELTGQRDMLLALPREKAPAELFETLQGQLERSVLLGSAADAVDAPRHINRWPHRGAIAAIVLLAAGLAVLVYKVLPSNKPPAEFAVAPKETGPVPATMETDEPKAEVPMAVSAKPGATSDADKIGFAKSAPPAAKGDDGAVAVAPSPVDAQTAPNAAGPSVEPAPSVALAPAPAPSVATPAPSLAPTPSDTANSVTASPVPAPSVAPPNLSIAATPAPGAGPNTSTPAGAIAEDQAKSSANANGQLALAPSAASNSVNVTEQPLANAMNKTGGELGKNGAFEKAGGGGGFGGGGGGAGLPGAGQGRAFGVSAAPSWLLVSTDDPSIAAEQIKAYLTANAINWEPTQTPVQLQPGPLELGQNDYVAMSRNRSQQVEVTSQTEIAKAMPNDRYRYAAKDVSPDRRAEAEAMSQKRALDQSAAGKKNEALAPATQPAVSDVTVAQANTPAASAAAVPTSQPVADEKAQVLADAMNQSQAFYCRDISAEQQRELQVVLAARPGQTARIIPQSSAGQVIETAAQQAAPPTPANQTADLNINTAPTTVPANESAGQSKIIAGHLDQATIGPAQQQDQQLQRATRDATQQPANQSTNVNNNEAQQPAVLSQQQAPVTSQPPSQSPLPGEAQQAAPQAEPRVDLLIVVRRDTTSATQPATAEPVAPPVLKAP